MTKCCQSRCTEAAVFSFEWPGDFSPRHVCPGHAAAAKRIADAMGFNLRFTVMPEAEQVVDNEIVEAEDKFEQALDWYGRKL